MKQTLPQQNTLHPGTIKLVQDDAKITNAIEGQSFPEIVQSLKQHCIKPNPKLIEKLLSLLK